MYILERSSFSCNSGDPNRYTFINLNFSKRTRFKETPSKQTKNIDPLTQI